jgi:hypothetical protein
MPRLRAKQTEQPARVSPTDLVFALTDLSKGGRFVRKGEPLRCDDVIVVERPDCFEVRYPLTLEEVKTNGDK